MAQDSFQKYQDDFDRKEFGAGSQKSTDRFSGLDVRKMFDARGSLSKAEGAQMVLDYADKAKAEGSRMGGGTEDALNKLRGYLGSDTPAKDPTESPGIQLSDRAAGAIGGTRAFEDAQASGLLSDMRFGGTDGSSSADAVERYKNMYKDNVVKAMSDNAGIEAGQSSDTGTTGGGEFTFTPAKSIVAEKIAGKKAGFQSLF